MSVLKLEMTQKFLLTLMIVPVFSFLLGCESLERSKTSGYGLRSWEQNEQLANAGRGPEDWIRKLERNLTSRRDVELYSRTLPLLANAEERIEFLSLPDLETRKEWIQANRIFARAQASQKEFSSIVSSKDIALGMTESLVKASWGDPDQVEVSGHPLFKNQRWKYIQQQPSQDGFITEKRTVYFEAGRVVGWDTD